MLAEGENCDLQQRNLNIIKRNLVCRDICAQVKTCVNKQDSGGSKKKKKRWLRERLTEQNKRKSLSLQVAVRTKKKTQSITEPTKQLVSVGPSPVPATA